MLEFNLVQPTNDSAFKFSTNFNFNFGLVMGTPGLEGINAATSSFAQESDISGGELSTFDPLFDPALFLHSTHSRVPTACKRSADEDVSSRPRKRGRDTQGRF
jgi:hypothetical protein